MGLAVAEFVGEVRRHVRQQHVVGDVVRADEADAEDQRRPVVAEDLGEVALGGGLDAVRRLGGVCGAALQLLEGRGLVQAQSQVEADEAEGSGDEEGDAPAPGFHLGVVEEGVERRDEAGGSDVSGEGAEFEEAAEVAASLVGGVLRDERGGAAVFAAGGEALEHPEDDEEDGGPDADGVVGGDDADGEGADRHEDHGEGEDLLAADLVAHGAEEHAAQRSYEEGDGEGGERGEELGCVVPGREEDMAQGGGEVGVDAEVEPLHGVTERGRLDCALDRLVVRDGDVRPAQLGVLALSDGTEEGGVAFDRFGVGRLMGVGGRHGRVLSSVGVPGKASARSWRLQTDSPVDWDVHHMFRPFGPIRGVFPTGLVPGQIPRSLMIFATWPVARTL